MNPSDPRLLLSYITIVTVGLLHYFSRMFSAFPVQNEPLVRDSDSSGLSSRTSLWRPAQVSSAIRCEPPDIPNEYFLSKSEEDRKLMKWFGSICGGTYLELGGLDGRMFSNSFVFNKALGWKGVLIELRQDNFEKMVVNRPDEIASINAGVCDKPQTLHAVHSELGAVSGIYEFAAPSFKERWWPGISLENDPRVQPIECDTLDNLLLKYAPEATHFDFLSLDVEGAEFSVLKSIDFDRTQFGIVLVEADEHNEMKNIAMREFLEKEGYRFLFEYERSYWFVNANFNEIYQNLIYQT